MMKNLCYLGEITDVGSGSRFRISEAMRIAGSLVFILLLFILTAVLVKVPMEEDRFFSVTMATIWFINCKSKRMKA